MIAKSSDISALHGFSLVSLMHMGQSPPHPPLSLRSEVGRLVFLLEGLCAALRVPWPTSLLSCQNLR